MDAKREILRESRRTRLLGFIASIYILLYFVFAIWTEVRIENAVRLKELQKISPAHERFIGEYLDCMAKLVVQSKWCMNQLILKYGNKEESKILEVILNEAELIN